MLCHSLKHFPAQVEAVEVGVTLLQPGNYLKRLGIMIEAAERYHFIAKRPLSGMPERGMTKVVGKGQCLGQILVQIETAAYRTGNL